MLLVLQVLDRWRRQNFGRRQAWSFKFSRVIMTQRYTREQLFERNNVLVNKRDEEREKEEIERKIKKLKDNEEDMLIALKKFDDDMAMQINRQKREIERVKERIQDLKQEVRVEKSTVRYLIILPIMILIYGQIYN